jgi:integrase
LSLDKHILTKALRKKLRPTQRRELAAWVQTTYGVPCVRACRLAQFSRAAWYRRSQRDLQAALRVLCQRGDGSALTQRHVDGYVRRAARRAGLRNCEPHSLRHTFCSHLAMRGAPARAIQELAGPRSLRTTMRYMHLSPAALESAIRLLEATNSVQIRGDIVETAHP